MNNTSNTNVIYLQEMHLINLNHPRKNWQFELLCLRAHKLLEDLAILLGKDIQIINKLQCEEGIFVIC
jgi:hypothetical protein